MSQMEMAYDTRDESYKATMEKGVTKAQREVLTCIELYGYCSNADIASNLGWPINRVTPRVHELRDMGLVVRHGTELDPITKRNVATWRKV